MQIKTQRDMYGANVILDGGNDNKIYSAEK